MTQNPDKMISFYQSNLEYYLHQLRDMVAINSFTDNPAGVNQLGQLTSSLFAGIGFISENLPSENPAYGEHVFLRREARNVNKKSETIALISHLDTVFSADEEIQNNFTWRPNGERIYGPGTVDIKGGTIMAYMLLSGVKRFAANAFESTNWLVALNAAEERLSEDFTVRCRERLPATTRACLVFEGGTISSDGYPIVVGRKGLATYDVIVKGRSAHSGNAHELGANAIVQAAHTIEQIASFTDYAQDLTFNVGVISGGSVVNRVPHHTELRVEMRAFNPEVFQAGIDRMLLLNGSSQVSSSDGFPCKVQVELRRQTLPWPRNPGTDLLYQLWSNAGKKLNLHAIPEQRGGLSDGNYLWQHYPTIDGLGPSGGNAHCSQRSEDGTLDQEFIEVGSLVPKAALNLMAVLELLQA